MPEHQQIQKSKKPDAIFQKQTTNISPTQVSNPFSIIQRAKINPKSLTHADVMQLQRTIGNRAVGRLLSGLGNPSTAQQAPVQREESPELEEEVQMKPVVQREESKEEELLQGKMIETIQRQEPEDEEELMQGKFASGLTGTLQAKEEAPPNRTGMPDHLKSGLENLSGMDLSGVRVHYNSPKPPQINALAYTQGQEIHVAPGQEKHVPHEAWHAVQQMQERVKPTGEVGGMPLNDSMTLESEADSMGRKALQKYARVEKPKESKSQSVANVDSQKQSSSESTFQFLDNRPEAVAQRKLQEMANNSPRVSQLKTDAPSFEREGDLMGGKATIQEKSVTNEVRPRPISFITASLGNSELVAQRVIEVDGKDYNAEDQEAFEKRYDKRHQDGMLAAIKEFSQPPKDISAALADPRHFLLTFQDDHPKYGVLYEAETAAFVSQVQGGQVREAAERPEFVRKPEAGFEQIDISGLIMCIGIVIEAKKDDQVTAAFLAHFVTPNALNKGNLNERGTSQLNTMLQHAKPHGNLTAILCHAASAKNIDLKKEKSVSMNAMEALNEIVSFLLSNGVSGVKIRETGSKISYCLKANGNSSLNG
ncbi:MAG: hypothetical protein QG646_2123 [Euryarchaeota archaeon]|nr:hypothetical protein [Euryarchaeota archaeon]